MRAAFAAAALAAAAGCSDPSYEDGNLRCALSQPACPSGFHCAADDTCWRDGEDPDLAPADLAGRDFSMPDLTPIDLSTTFDLTADDSGCTPVDPNSCCGELVTPCNQTITCTIDCAATSGGQLCGGAGFPNACGCPTDSRTGVYRLLAPSGGGRCYTTEAAPGVPPSECVGYTLEGTTPKFYVYAADAPPGTKALLRCFADPLYFLTFDPGCDGVSGAVVDGTIGAVPPAPVCGTVALHRYDVGTAGRFYTTDPSEAPGGANELLPPFYVWPN